MKVIAGKYKNYKIDTKTKNKEQELRPTLGKIREAIFNILTHSSHFNKNLIEQADILDICCGTGAFGIEAISRGAKKVTFIDKVREHLDLAKNNVKKISEETKCQFICCDATTFEISGPGYDIVYVDAPYYDDGISQKILHNLTSNSNALKSSSIILLEVAKKVDIDTPKELQLFDERRYGIAKILFLKQAK